MPKRVKISEHPAKMRIGMGTTRHGCVVEVCWGQGNKSRACKVQRFAPAHRTRQPLTPSFTMYWPLPQSRALITRTTHVVSVPVSAAALCPSHVLITSRPCEDSPPRGFTLVSARWLSCLAPSAPSIALSPSSACRYLTLLRPSAPVQKRYELKTCDKKNFFPKKRCVEKINSCENRFSYEKRFSQEASDKPIPFFTRIFFLNTPFFLKKFFLS